MMQSLGCGRLATAILIHARLVGIADSNNAATGGQVTASGDVVAIPAHPSLTRKLAGAQPRAAEREPLTTDPSALKAVVPNQDGPDS